LLEFTNHKRIAIELDEEMQDQQKNTLSLI